MIRTVQTGDLGLDVLLGGGWRLVERLRGRESATVLLRGGPGSGKTLLAIDVALSLARALESDVVVACVEMLPSEFAAQIEAGRAELALKWREGPPIDAPRVVTLPSTERLSHTTDPRLYCGLLPDIDEDQPDIVAALEDLQHEVRELGAKPAVVLIDSLIGGYGLGSTAPRKNVDAVMKYAAKEGLGIVLCEESIDDRPSAWAFAADTVLELDHPAEGGRRVLVRKHRYGASASGKHELEIQGWKQPRVIPQLDSWVGKHWIQPTLRAQGWRFSDAVRIPRLSWITDVRPVGEKTRTYDCSLALVACTHLGVARKLAFGLVPEGDESRHDVVIELDQLGNTPSEAPVQNVDVHFLPTTAGAEAALCELVQYLGSRLAADSGPGRLRRIVLGDLAVVASSSASTAWAEAIRVIAGLVARSGAGVPIITYDSSSTGIPGLHWSVELAVAVDPEKPKNQGLVTARRAGTCEWLSWTRSALFDHWPKEIEHLAQLPRRGDGSTPEATRGRLDRLGSPLD